MIGGELQERLIPVPYSKSSTDQAVSVPLLLSLYFLLFFQTTLSSSYFCSFFLLSVYYIYASYVLSTPDTPLQTFTSLVLYFFFFIVHYLFRFISLQFSWIIFFNFIISTLFPNSSSISILYFIYLIYSLCSIVYSTVVIYCFLDCHRFCFCVVIFINIIIADFNLDPRRYNFFLFSKTFFFRIAIYKYVTKYTMDISKSWT